jgi:hypothetical protein
MQSGEPADYEATLSNASPQHTRRVGTGEAPAACGGFNTSAGLQARVYLAHHEAALTNNGIASTCPGGSCLQPQGLLERVDIVSVKIGD